MSIASIHTLHLIRHAQSQANLEGVVCGQLDSPLSEVGRKQAIVSSRMTTIRELTKWPCFTSTLVRSIDTARLLGFHQVQAFAGFNETNTGDLSRQPVSTVEDTYPQFKHFATDLMARYPGGETTAEMLERSWNTFCDVRAAAQVEEIVIVGHGGPLNSIVSRLLGVGFESFPSFKFDNVKVTTVHRAQGVTDRWYLSRMNAE